MSGSKRGQQRRRHLHVVFPLALGGVDDVVELYRHRQVFAPGEHQPEQEVVPDSGNLQDHRHHDHRHRHRQHDGAEDAPEAGAVDACGLEQFDRQAREVIAEDQRHRRQAEDGVHEHDAGDGVVQSDEGEDPHQRIDEDLVWHEGDRHQHAEQQLRPARAPERQGVAGQRPDRDRHDDAGHQDAHGVPEPHLDAVAVEAGAGAGPGLHPGIGAGLRRQGENVAEPHLRHQFQRGDEHDVERCQEESRGDRQEGIDADPRRRQPARAPAMRLREAGAHPAWPAAAARRCCQYSHGPTTATMVISIEVAAAVARPIFARSNR